MKQKICLFFPAVENPKFSFVVEGKADSIYTYRIIRKRCVRLGFFRMLDIRVHNNQIVLCNRKDLVFNEKLSISITDIKKFCKRMGMPDAGPVLTIMGRRGIYRIASVERGFPSIKEKDRVLIRPPDCIKIVNPFVHTNITRTPYENLLVFE